MLSMKGQRQCGLTRVDGELVSVAAAPPYKHQETILVHSPGYRVSPTTSHPLPEGDRQAFHLLRAPLPVYREEPSLGVRHHRDESTATQVHEEGLVGGSPG